MCVCVCAVSTYVCMCASVMSVLAFCICTCACAFRCDACAWMCLLCVCMYIVARGQQQVSSSTILHYDFVVVVLFCFEARFPTEPGFQRQAGLTNQ